MFSYLTIAQTLQVGGFYITLEYTQDAQPMWKYIPIAKTLQVKDSGILSVCLPDTRKFHLTKAVINSKSIRISSG